MVTSERFNQNLFRAILFVDERTRQVLDVSCNQLADLPTSVSTLKSLEVNWLHLRRGCLVQALLFLSEWSS